MIVNASLLKIVVLKHPAVNLTNKLINNDKPIFTTEEDKHLCEKTIIVRGISPHLTVLFLLSTSNYTPLRQLGDFVAVNVQIVNSGKQILHMMKELELPPVKPIQIQLTDAGPGIGR